MPKYNNEYTHGQRLRRRLTVLKIVYITYLTCFFDAVAIVLLAGHDVQVGDVNLGFLGSFTDLQKALWVITPVSLVIALCAYFFAGRKGSISVFADPNDPARFTVIEGYQLNNIVDEMCVAAGLSKRPTVLLAEDTKIMNAWVTEDENESYLVVTRPLAEALDRYEMEAVIGHEIGHLRQGDCIELTKLMALAVGLTATTDFMFRFASFGGFGGGSNRRSSSDSNSGSNIFAIVVLVVAVVFILISPIIRKLTESAISRERENVADLNSVRYHHNPQALVSALRKIDSSSRALLDNDEEFKGELKKFNSTVGAAAFFNLGKVFATHPPIEDRIRYISSLNTMSN